jgi:hypothetical protein
MRGVFCLAKTPGQVCFVGRAEKDLRMLLKTYVGKYPFFWFETSLSPDECYITHCRLYHKHSEHGSLDDPLHPVPEKPGQKCPVCGT